MGTSWKVMASRKLPLRRTATLMLGENREGSIGLPLPGVECRIVDLDSGTQRCYNCGGSG